MFWSTVFVSRRSRFSIEATRLGFSANSAVRPKGLSPKISFRIVTLKMRNSLLFALLGAIYVAAEGHLFTYDDDQHVGRDRSYYSPSYYVSRTPPGLGRSHGHGSGHRGQYYPSYYVSRSLPRWPMRPHGQGPIYDYAPPSHLGRSIYRESRTKKKSQGRPIKGGWWYKWTKKGLISGRWGAPPPPGLEKEHYIYGGGNGGGWGWGGGGWGQSYHSQGGGNGGHGGHGSHGPWGGKPSFHKHSHGPIHHSHGGLHKHGHGGGYGSGGGWGWGNQGWGGQSWD